MHPDDFWRSLLGWCFGVCRPGIELTDGRQFYNRTDTWMMWQHDDYGWNLHCSTCKGTGMSLDPKVTKDVRRLSDWVVVGLGQRRYFDHVLGHRDVTVIKIHGGLAPPQ